MIKNLILAGAGGGLGSILRYLCSRWLGSVTPGQFPWGTFGVNMTGCFLIGLLWGLSFKSFDSNESWKIFLMVGLCGGFTTFSAFSLEGVGLLRENRIGLFVLYAAGSVMAGLLLTLLGMRLAR